MLFLYPFSKSLARTMYLETIREKSICYRKFKQWEKLVTLVANEDGTVPENDT